VRSRRTVEDDRAQRPDYEGMGLGLFIAKTLLERSGAELSFANGANPFLSEHERPVRSGAIVEVVWPRNRLVASESEALGENPRIET
jgi:two-component system sensor histidine kinase RegB